VKNNLGRKKLDIRKQKHTQHIRDKVFKAVHSVADKAKTIACEDLSAPIQSKRQYGKDTKRRLAGWVKGSINEALQSVSQRRGSTLVFVNCAYTSQTDSRCGILLGHRNGETFYCFDGVVLHADENAARNILARKDDPEIQVWTPYEKVKSILLDRTDQFQKRLGLLNQGSSCSEQQLGLPLSTECELLDNFEQVERNRLQYALWKSQRGRETYFLPGAGNYDYQYRRT